jgi:branched-chain amino acid transport system permease protein
VSVDRVRWAIGLYIGLAAIVVAATYLGSLGSTTVDRAVVNALIVLILVLGLSTFVGTSGVFSFGHMAFMAIGAYVTAVLTMSPEQKRLQLADLPGSVGTWHISPLLAVIIGALAAALFATVVAVPLMRLSGLTASLATVALLITMRVVFQNWETFTRGTRGLILDAKSPSRETVLLAALVMLAIAVAFRFSSVGRRLSASREDEPSARSLGIRVWWERGLAWVLSAFMVGIAGGLFSLYFRNISPDSFYIAITFNVLAMLVIGGLKSVSGAVIGTVVVTAALEVLRQIERGWTIAGVTIPSRLGMSELGLAVVLLVILIVRPDGLVPGELRWPRRRRARSAPHETPGSPSADGAELATNAAAATGETAPELRRAP